MFIQFPFPLKMQLLTYLYAFLFYIHYNVCYQYNILFNDIIFYKKIIINIIIITHLSHLLQNMYINILY